jgi:hypothetical protein
MSIGRPFETPPHLRDLNIEPGRNYKTLRLTLNYTISIKIFAVVKGVWEWIASTISGRY